VVAKRRSVCHDLASRSATHCQGRNILQGICVSGYRTATGGSVEHRVLRLLRVTETAEMKMNARRTPGSLLPRLGFADKLAAFGLIAGIMLAAASGPAQAEEVDKTFSITGHARVRIETDDAGVRVSTGDIKQVEVRVVYTGYKLDRDLRVNAQQNGDAVDIVAKTSGGIGFWNWGPHHASVRVEVHMPQNADLTVHSGDGSVEADSITGNVDVTTGDGSITVQGAKGNIRFHSGDGHIEARGLDGSVDASAGDGHISLEGRFDALSIRTGDGSVSARALAGSKVASNWTIHTGDGSVDLEVPGDLQADLDASTHDGHISMGLPVTVEGSFSSSSIHGKLNGGGATLSIRTGDGSIHLSKT
jgi:Putative adhesin